MKITVKYVVEDRDRHGNLRLYYRKAGQPKVRLRGPMGSPEFWQDYQAAVKNPKPKAKPKATTGLDRASMRWLISDYYASADFQRLDESTQKTRRNVLERFCLNQNDGDKPYALISAASHSGPPRCHGRDAVGGRIQCSKPCGFRVQTCHLPQRSCHLEPRSRRV